METANKSSSRKAPPKATRAVVQPRASEAIAAQRKQAALKVADLPEGFEAQGFVVDGDMVRVYGKVRPRISGTDAAPLQSMMQGSMAAEQIRSAPYQAPPTTTPARSSVVLDSLHAISRRIDEVWSAIEALEQAACSVLLPAPPAAGEGVSVPAPVQAPAIDLMDTLKARLEHLTAKINDITNRVQA